MGMNNKFIQSICLFPVVTMNKDLVLLEQQICDCIQDKPELCLDRLHTFVVKYIRTICEKHEIPTIKENPLDSIFGEYVRFLTKNKLVTSEMTIRILKSSISILEGFNRVRNEHSFAHPNALLNYDESLLICSNILIILRFLDAIEQDKLKDGDIFIKNETEHVYIFKAGIGYWARNWDCLHEAGYSEIDLKILSENNFNKIHIASSQIHTKEQIEQLLGKK